MTEINYVKLGLRIKQRRKEMNMTQERLAADLGVNPSHISNIENAHSYPSLTAVFTISNSLQCGIDYLLGEQFTFDHNVNSDKAIEQRLVNYIKYSPREQKEKFIKIIEIL